MKKTRSLRTLPAMLALCGLWMVSVPVHAGLFDDDEARKAILDLRARVTQLEQTHGAEIKQLTDQVQQLQSGLLDLNTQNEALRADLAKLRGTNEQLAHDLADVQRAQQDTAQKVTARLQKLEPQSVTIDGVTFSAEPDEKAAYDDAMNSMRSGDFDKATDGLNSLLKRYPQSGYGPVARYWLGNALYGQRDYKNSLATFRAFLTAAPNSPRVPEAMLAIANCQAEMKDIKGAKRTLDDLLKRFPQSEAAHAAKDRLTALK
jgi:tol-pal system protein YbgF